MLNLLKTKPALVVVLGAILVGGCNGSPRVTSRENAKPSSHLVKTQVGASPDIKGRAYGWHQLTKILSPDGAQPTWETWSSKCHLADDIAAKHPTWRMRLTLACDPDQKISFQDPTLTAVLRTAAASPQAADNPFRPASVFFNSVAVESINKGDWNLPDPGKQSPDALVPVSVSDTATVPHVTFEIGSIIVKAIWEVVNKENSAWPLRVYDSNHPQGKPGTDANHPQSLENVEGNNPNTGWATKIYLDVDDTKPCPYTSGNPASNISLGSTLPISCFVAHKITPEMYSVSMLGNNAGHWQGTYPFYLVLVGLNISTRDQGGWNFTTLWWTDNPVGDLTPTDGAPGDLSFKYTQFAMDTSQEAHPIHNPYLEGPQGRTGMESDCSVCHALAEIRVDKNTDKVMNSQPNFGLPDQLPNLPNNYDQNRILTDSVWTLATARDPEAPMLFRAVVRSSTHRNSAPRINRKPPRLNSTPQ